MESVTSDLKKELYLCKSQIAIAIKCITSLQHKYGEVECQDIELGRK